MVEEKKDTKSKRVYEKLVQTIKEKRNGSTIKGTYFFEINTTIDVHEK